jgi:hypothetical protein
LLLLLLLMLLFAEFYGGLDCEVEVVCFDGRLRSGALCSGGHTCILS